MDKIIESRAREQQRLKELKEKRQKLDEKIKLAEANIEKYTNMINQKKFSQVTDVLNSTGLSIDEVMAAIQKGDLLSLQEKIEEKDKSKKVSNGTPFENTEENSNDESDNSDKSEVV